MRNETIASVSTAFGKGGVAMIRISGSEAISIGEAMFHPQNGIPLGGIGHGKMVHGEILRAGKCVDDGMAVCFFAPHSFTGEDTVEIYCHGGILLTQLVLESAFLCGASPAEPGEFTQRAFCNGKLDLSQAEAVIDMIDAKSKEHLKLALSQLQGVLGDKVRALSEDLYQLLCSTYAYIDFPDEDLTDVSREELLERLEKIQFELCGLADTYHAGRAIAEGIPTVLFGRPNTGKSSLLNVLLGKDRAIVTDIAGTTRDTIEETVQVGKIQLRLCDTAGIRNAEGIEGIGVERALEKLSEAELVLAVFDSSVPLTEEDETVLSALAAQREGEFGEEKKILAVLNKCDLPAQLEYHRFHRLFDGVVEVSCLKGRGIEDLVARIETLFVEGELDYTQGVISNARQFAALQSAQQSVERAVNALQENYTQDVASLDLEAALGALKELDGRGVSEDIVSGIFSRFCVGK